ncbi:hypothetical protein L1887_50651 [Cichorium endivia]|nr:hypothetical protein L1887_50651 [Cichorium endivia]
MATSSASGSRDRSRFAKHHCRHRRGGSLEVLVEAVALGDEVLLPLSEARLLELDLLGEALAQHLLLLLELGVVELLHLGLAKLARLHLRLAVVLVVLLLGGVDEVEHMRADEQRAQLLEIAVLFVLHLGHTPQVLAALDHAAVGRAHVFGAADDGEGHGAHELLGVLGARRIVHLERRRVGADVLRRNHLADALLERRQIRLRQRVRLGHHGDEVDARAQTLHRLNVERLERVAGGADEVEACVDAQVGLFASLGLLLLTHVQLVLVVDKVDDGRPRVAVVDVVAKAGRVDDGELHLELLLLELGLDNVDLHRLVELLGVAARVVLARGELGAEERVDERRLAHAALTHHHERKVAACLGHNLVALIRQVGDADTVGSHVDWGRQERGRMNAQLAMSPGTDRMSDRRRASGLGGRDEAVAGRCDAIWCERGCRGCIRRRDANPSCVSFAVTLP